MIGGEAGGRATLTGFSGVGRAAPRRRATERATSVQSAISSSVSALLKRCEAGRRLLHRSSPCGRSTTNSAGWRMGAGACAPPRRRCRRRGSARAAPTIAEPVSWAIMSRRRPAGASSSAHGSSASIQNGRPYAQTASGRSPDRAQRGERKRRSARNRTEARVEIVDEFEEHKRAIAPHDVQASGAVATKPRLEAGERHGAFGDLSGLDQYLANRCVRQAVAAVIGEARAGAIGKLDLRGTLHLHEEGLDRIANPNDRVAALSLDLSAIGVRDERAVAQAPGAADVLRKPMRRGVETKRHEIRRAREYRPAKLLGFDPRSRDAGLIIAGQESPAVLGNNAEGSKPRLEKSASVSLGRRRLAKRRARVRDQFGRRGLRRPGMGLRNRPRRALEGAKRRLMVVIDPAREAVEISRLEAGRHGSRWRREAT